MNFEWDESKSDTCFLDRGFDFAYAAAAFADPDRIIRPDTRHSYGEDRYQLIGRITSAYSSSFTRRVTMRSESSLLEKPIHEK